MSTYKKLFIPLMLLIIVFIGIAVWIKMPAEESDPEQCAAALQEQVQLVCGDATGLVVVDGQTSTEIGIVNEPATTTIRVALTSNALDNDQQPTLQLPKNERLMIAPLK